MKVKFFSLFLFICSNVFSQVGVGTTTPNGALDVSSANQGIVPPRVALTSTLIEAPVINPNTDVTGLVPGTLVWNTNTSGTVPTNVAPGMYYWNGTRWISLAGSPGGLDWSIIGNGGIDGGTVTTGGTHFLGTYDNTNIDIRTNGIHRARVSALGEFFIGAYNTVLPGDLMNGVSVGNPLFPFAINGYTDQDGSGVYGLVQGGNTFFAGVQGEYSGTSPRGAGVRGLIGNTTAGSNFTEVIAGVQGDGSLTPNSSGAYKFGVSARGGFTARSGAIFADDFGVASAALAYFANNGNDYAVYGFGQNYTIGGVGRVNNEALNTTIGLGIHGGVVGGWVKGKDFGLINSGNKFASYNMGKTITNENFIVLDAKKDGTKSVSYATTSMSVDVQDKGVSKLENGEIYVLFNKSFSQLINLDKPVVITVSPVGESNGLYISNVDENGFTIKENLKGRSNVSFNWIAIGEKNVNNYSPIAGEILSKDFDSNLNEVMHNENVDGGKSIWSENGQVYFSDKAPINPFKQEKIKTVLSAEKPKM